LEIEGGVVKLNRQAKMAHVLTSMSHDARLAMSYPFADHRWKESAEL
jgi:hypothetical protein